MKRGGKMTGRRRPLPYSAALLLAALNDVLDLVGLGAPVPELLIDALLAVSILVSLRDASLTALLSALLDLVTGLDVLPIWLAYVAKRGRRWRR